MTVVEIARLAGVSASSVSNYFNRPDRVGAATAARIRAVVNRVGYEPDFHRPGPKTGDRIGLKNRRILLLAVGVASPRAFLEQPWGASLLEGASAALASRRLALQFACAATPAELPDAIARKGCDGVIVAGEFEDVQAEYALRELLQQLASVRIFLHTTLLEPEPWRLACANRAGGILAALFLRKQGRKHIAVFNPEGGVPAYVERAAAFRRAARLCGMECTEFVIPATRRIPARFHPARFRLLAEMYRQSPVSPDGFFFCSDKCMAGVTRKLRGGAKQIDLRRAVGCGGDERTLFDLEPRPATVSLSFDELGRESVAMLAERLRNGVPPQRPRILRPELLPGGSRP